MLEVHSIPLERIWDQRLGGTPFLPPAILDGTFGGTYGWLVAIPHLRGILERKNAA